MTMTIKKGKTFSRVLRPTAPPYIYKAITAITKTAPVQITAPGHGMVSGQYAAIVSVKGMVQINGNVPPKDKDYHKATVVDADTVTVNDINAADFNAYVSGGYLQFLTPVDMSGCVARRSIKDKIAGTELLRLDTSNGGLVIDNVNHTITERIEASVTTAITWKKGVTDLELETATGYVTEIDAEDVAVTVAEVTTT